MKLIALIALLVFGSPFAKADAFKKFVFDPAPAEVVLDRECVLQTLRLENADGEPLKVERDKEIDLVSSQSSTEFFAYYEPACADAVKFTFVTLPAGKSSVKFYLKDTLSKTVPSPLKSLPHQMTITAKSRGVRSATKEVEVRSRDCGEACLESCIATRLSCTKSCGGAGGEVGGPAEGRRCWHACSVAEESCVAICETKDVKLADRVCPKMSYLSYCEEKYKCCFSRCYFNSQTGSTSFGAKCVDECSSLKTKCWEKEEEGTI